MITGYNTDVRHNEVVFHVQTEDKGLGNPCIESLVYVGGQVLASKRASYAEMLAEVVIPHPHGGRAIPIAERYRLQFRAEIFNLTDEENFAPIFDGGFFGSTNVLPELPRSFMLSLTHRF